jgi:hypothetical protein
VYGRVEEEPGDSTAYRHKPSPGVCGIIALFGEGVKGRDYPMIFQLAGLEQNGADFTTDVH